MGYGYKRRWTPFTALQGRFSPPARGLRAPRPKRGCTGSTAPTPFGLQTALPAPSGLLPGRGGRRYRAYALAGGGRFDVDPLLNIAQAAQLLGVKPQTLYLWVSQKRIAYRKIGRLVRFTMGDLEDYVERQRQLPVDSNHERF